MRMHSRVIAAVVVTLAAALAPVACSSATPGNPPFYAGSGGSGATSADDLATALAFAPKVADGSVLFTDWAALKHVADPNAAAYAGAVVSYDSQLHQDLGIRSTDAQWELDVAARNTAPLTILGFDQSTDLGSVSAKLTGFGYHADGSVLSRSTTNLDQNHLWTQMFAHVGIDTRHNLLLASYNQDELQLALIGLNSSANSLAGAPGVGPLLDLARTKLGHVATAALSLGSFACVKLRQISHTMTPALLARLRQMFSGRFDPPQAELLAQASPTDKTALDGLSFADQATAQANEASRSAAVATFNQLRTGEPDATRVVGSAVTDNVLSFQLAGAKPTVFGQQMLSGGLGVDICT